MTKGDGRKRLPEIEVFKAAWEILRYLLLANKISKWDLVRALFDFSHLGDFAIDLIVRKSVHDLIRHVCHRFKDGHDDEHIALP